MRTVSFRLSIASLLFVLGASVTACSDVDPSGASADNVTESEEYTPLQLVTDARSAARALGLSESVGSLGAALIYWETGRLTTEAAPAANPSNNVFAIGEGDCLARAERPDYQRLDAQKKAYVDSLFANQTGCTAFAGIGAGTLSRLVEVSRRPFPVELTDPRLTEDQRETLKPFAQAWQDPATFLRTGTKAQKVFLALEAMALCEFNVTTFARLQYWNKGPNWNRIAGDLEYANNVRTASRDLGFDVQTQIDKLLGSTTPACATWAR